MAPTRGLTIPRFADESELRAWVNALDEDEIAAFYDSQAVASEAEQAYMDEVFDEAWELGHLGSTAHNRRQNL